MMLRLSTHTIEVSIPRSSLDGVDETLVEEMVTLLDEFVEVTILPILVRRAHELAAEHGIVPTDASVIVGRLT